MANMAIIDTGYLKATSVSGTQATQANSGDAVTLKGAKLIYDSTANTDSSAITNSTQRPVIGYGSVSAPTLVFTGVLNKTDSDDMSAAAYLDQMQYTYGVKLLYYTDTTDGYREITDVLGTGNSDDVHKAGFFSGTSTPHLHVRVTGFRLEQDAKSPSHFRYTLTMEVTE